MKYVLYTDEGDEVMKADNEKELADLINWAYEHEQGIIVDENGNQIEY